MPLELPTNLVGAPEFSSSSAMQSFCEGNCPKRLPDEEGFAINTLNGTPVSTSMFRHQARTTVEPHSVIHFLLRM